MTMQSSLHVLWFHHLDLVFWYERRKFAESHFSIPVSNRQNERNQNAQVNFSTPGNICYNHYLIHIRTRRALFLSHHCSMSIKRSQIITLTEQLSWSRYLHSFKISDMKCDIILVCTYSIWLIHDLQTCLGHGTIERSRERWRVSSTTNFHRMYVILNAPFSLQG